MTKIVRNEFGRYDILPFYDRFIAKKGLFLGGIRPYVPNKEASPFKFKGILLDRRSLLLWLKRQRWNCGTSMSDRQLRQAIQEAKRVFSVFPLERVSPEILSHIFSYCLPFTVVNIACVANAFNVQAKAYLNRAPFLLERCSYFVDKIAKAVTASSELYQLSLYQKNMHGKKLDLKEVRSWQKRFDQALSYFKAQDLFQCSFSAKDQWSLLMLLSSPEARKLPSAEKEWKRLVAELMDLFLKSVNLSTVAYPAFLFDLPPVLELYIRYHGSLKTLHLSPILEAFPSCIQQLMPRANSFFKALPEKYLSANDRKEALINKATAFILPYLIAFKILDWMKDTKNQSHIKNALKELQRLKALHLVFELELISQDKTLL